VFWVGVVGGVGSEGGVLDYGRAVARHWCAGLVSVAVGGG